MLLIQETIFVSSPNIPREMFQTLFFFFLFFTDDIDLDLLS